jgi:hypothetical protein
VWVYPATSNVLKECRMNAIAHYIGVRRETTFLIRGEQANSRIVHGGRAEKGISAATVVVGAEDVPGR